MVKKTDNKAIITAAKTKIDLNEDYINKFKKLIDSIYISLNSPLPQVNDPNSGINNYTDKEGKTHFSKMLRNSIASQRLYSFLDRVKDLIFTHQYFAKDIELNNDKVDRKFFETYLSRNLIFLDIQLVNGLINFLSYFFDLPTKDDKINNIEFRNFLNIKDKEICLEIEKVLKSNEFQKLNTIFTEIKNDYAGLPKITNRIITNEQNSIEMDAPKGYQLGEILPNSSELINKIYLFLQFLSKHLKKNYKNSLGSNSSSDFVSEVDPKNKLYKASKLEEIEKEKQNIPIKIFNLITDSPQQIDTKYFKLYKNHTFEELKDRFYKPNITEKTTIKIEPNFPTKKTIIPPQEGECFWTHTFKLEKLGFNKKSKFLKNADFAEDICLLLSLFSGVGVYTEKSVFRYSHKTKSSCRLQSSEFQESINNAIERIDNSDDPKINILGLALSKYREAMQPMGDNNRIVRLWEVLDILADFYCKNPKKEIPKGYDKKSLKNTIEIELEKIENNTKIPLIKESGFTPFSPYKSIRKKIKELIEFIKLHDLLGIELSELNKKILKANDFRGDLTHSSKVDFTKDKDKRDLVRYSIFVSQLIFVILLKLFNISPNHTLLILQNEIQGFVKDKDYYHKKSEAYKKKNEEFDQFAKNVSSKGGTFAF